jgi:hypothetical protein
MLVLRLDPFPPLLPLLGERPVELASILIEVRIHPSTAFASMHLRTLGLSSVIRPFRNRFQSVVLFIAGAGKPGVEHLRIQ